MTPRTAARAKRDPLVVLLRGVNVGGHRSFRPTTLAKQLEHLGAVNIGAAGTLVIRRPGTQAELRAELARHLPFSTEIMICGGREITRLLSRDLFAGQPEGTQYTRFLSVLGSKPRGASLSKVQLPSTGPWLLRVVGHEGRFVFGVYRRHMKVIGYLGSLDKTFGAPATTRNWNTVEAIGRVLAEGAP